MVALLAIVAGTYVKVALPNTGEPPVIHRFGRMDKQDIYDIIAYIRTLTPVSKHVPVSRADFPVNFIINTMPWAMYAGMTNKDLEAIYDYLRSVKKIKNKVVRFSPGN